MTTKKILIPLIALLTSLAWGSQALAAGAGPAWKLSVTSLPSNFVPGAQGSGQIGPTYDLLVSNAGAASTTEPITISDTLPGGLTPVEVSGKFVQGPSEGFACGISGQTVTCTESEVFVPGRLLEVTIAVKVDPLTPEGSVLNEARIEGGGATPISASVPTRIGAANVPFGFLPGFDAPLSGADGGPVTQAGSHPYQLTVDMAFPTRQPVNSLIGSGHLRDAIADLPRGEIVDPAATPVLCTEVELVSSNETCPPASQIGTISILTVGTVIEIGSSPLYNMVTPPGMPSNFGFNALGVGVFSHITGSVRSDGDYGLSGASNDILALPFHPVFGIRIELWGDPSSSAHDGMRGLCVFRGGCVSEGEGAQVEPTDTALLTAPTECAGRPLTTVGRADSWEEPGVEREADYESADLEGNPVSLSGCNALEFKPTLSAQPTTNLADSPSGLEVDLHQPQNAEFGHLPPASLKDATVTLPAGMAVNPSQASGLDVCGPGQIGLLTEVGETPAHLSKRVDSCPEAAKIGTLEVTTPLLVEHEDEGTKLATDPETGEPIPRPLHGSVFLAQPFQNPFGSLLAIYLEVNDPQSGTIAKLAGKVEPDPQTGQLTTVFEENPELPLEDVKLHLFGGARGSLITPLTCGSHTTTTTLTPWSTPEGADAHPVSSFQTTSEPGGGNCPTSEGAAANAPSFTAGTISPQAGAYSPFVLRISREDGSQRLTGIDTLLPEGLTGKLAGIAECSDQQIAQAQARSHPNEGVLERNTPSCPAASEVGTVTVGAGAGPTPYYTTGHAYLAGPYKGAPLSLAVIVPAIAGPFDLGTVVTRVALRVEPETTRIHAVSDPLPTILDGVPLDVRSVALKMERPGFTLNPTSCDPMAITGTATSSLGQGAALNQRFQVGGCSALPFKPKLSLRLKGKVRRTAHPRLIANLRAKEGEANIARAQVKLPHSAFLDQGHINTVCTRVQWAANTCPAGSVYGSVWATTPLLAYKLTGQVYLRSSSHKLPDLVAKLMGPASQPIEIDLDGRTDSVKGALRNTFEAVPDAPVSAFHLELFGGKRGLIEMSSGFCKNRHAAVDLTGQNGKVNDTRPVVAAKCPKRHRRHHKKRKAHHKGAHGKRGGGK